MLARIANAVRAALSRLRAGVSAVWWEMVEVVDDGVRLVRAVLRMGTPSAPPEMDMMAQEVVADAPADAVVEGHDLESARRFVRRPEPERVKRAATDLYYGRRVDADDLDPSAPPELQILRWLADLSELELGMVAKADTRAIAGLLIGDRPIPVRPFRRDGDDPGPAGASASLVAFDRDPEQLDEQAWYDHLLAEAYDLGDDDPDLDALEEKATRFARDGMTVAEYQARWPVLADEID